MILTLVFRPRCFTQLTDVTVQTEALAVCCADKEQRVHNINKGPKSNSCNRTPATSACMHASGECRHAAHPSVNRRTCPIHCKMFILWQNATTELLDSTTISHAHTTTLAAATNHPCSLHQLVGHKEMLMLLPHTYPPTCPGWGTPVVQEAACAWQVAALPAVNKEPEHLCTQGRAHRWCKDLHVLVRRQY